MCLCMCLHVDLSDSPRCVLIYPQHALVAFYRTKLCDVQIFDSIATGVSFSWALKVWLNFVNRRCTTSSIGPRCFRIVQVYHALCMTLPSLANTQHLSGRPLTHRMQRHLAQRRSVRTFTQGGCYRFGTSSFRLQEATWIVGAPEV